MHGVILLICSLREKHYSNRLLALSLLCSSNPRKVVVRSVSRESFETHRPLVVIIQALLTITLKALLSVGEIFDAQHERTVHIKVGTCVLKYVCLVGVVRADKKVDLGEYVYILRK